MKKFEVAAEFVDRETGERFLPAAKGDAANTFTPHDDDQAERLIAAGCLREPKTAAKAAASAKSEKEGAKA